MNLKERIAEVDKKSDKLAGLDIVSAAAGFGLAVINQEQREIITIQQEIIEMQSEALSYYGNDDVYILRNYSGQNAGELMIEIDRGEIAQKALEKTKEIMEK